MKNDRPIETLEQYLARGGQVQEVVQGMSGYLALRASSPEGKHRSVEKVNARKSRRGRSI